MKLRKISALVLTASMIISVNGCVNNKTQEDTSQKTTTNDSNSVEYDDTGKLFDTSFVHTVNVIINEEDWEDLRENPTDKTKYKVDVEIDGEKYEQVSFATKGNTSLTSVASDPDSDRYSFKINFGKYVDDQTYHGLNKLSLNNIYADATYMKDYISYYTFRLADVEAPLVSYVDLKINGESFGLYLALEDISESFLERTDSSDSAVYKPETEMLGNMDQTNDMPSGNFTPDNLPDGEQPSGDFNPGNMPGGFNPGNLPDGERPSEDFNPGNMPGGELPSGDFTPGDMPAGNMFAAGSQGADLKYTDDNFDSYSDIFDNAETDITDEDKQQVIDALKKLSEGNASEALDVTEVISYFVAHNFVLNYDSYTGIMLHNYYLLETDGKLSIVPWDYNLAFGGFVGTGTDNSDATALINTGIDSPLSGSTEASRPLWAFITSNEEYLSQYHTACQELIDKMNSGALTTEIQRIYEMIRPYVEKDASAFFTVEEFDTAVETLRSFCTLRAESITKQLEGKLSTTTSSQNADDKVDASGINIKTMGDMGKNNDNNSFPTPSGNAPSMPDNNKNDFQIVE